jgi:hypothetical protein
MKTIMENKIISIRATCIIALLVGMILVTLTSCEDESDMAVNKVASPVLLEIKDSPGELTAYFFELDKTGILDHTVGIDSIPLANLQVEVFAATTSVGVFTTDVSGSILVTYAGTKPNVFAGEYKGKAFRFLK